MDLLSTNYDDTWPWPEFQKNAQRNVYRLRDEVLTGWEGDFLDALRRTGIVEKAAFHAKISSTTARHMRKRNANFARAWDEAMTMAVDALEDAAWKRAVKGTSRERVIYYKGKEVGRETVTEYSDNLLKFLLTANRPEKYREQVDHNHNLRIVEEQARQLAREKGIDEERVVAEALRLFTQG